MSGNSDVVVVTISVTFSVDIPNSKPSKNVLSRERSHWTLIIVRLVVSVIGINGPIFENRPLVIAG